ncbi:MAG: PEP-CTERM system histidine kinase PrsK [Gemmatimonadaceae bacterium]|nr:PEP-CTERM system histidine kinase PrsK [Acetobacteraceae bacterium]
MATLQVLFGACAAVYVLLPALIVARARHATAWLMVACCLMTAAWAAANTIDLPNGLRALPSALDLVRALFWYGFVLHLYRRTVSPDQAGRGFLLIGGIAMVLAGAAIALEWDGSAARPSLLTLSIVVRLGIAVCALLLIENLYLNLPEHSRWHVALPCVMLGGLACFDILLCADLVLFQKPSMSLTGAQAVAMIIVAPLLGVAASRDRNWRIELQLSRTAVFHSATLILSGAVLLALSAAGEVFRQFGADWGWMAEVSLFFAALIGIGMLLTSGSARSRLRRMVVEHFFARRYDYRVQWLDCIDTLSDTKSQGRTALHTRVIRAMADVVDSPNGVLFLRDGGVGAFQWSGSWNMPASAAVPPDHPVVGAMQDGQWIAVLDGTAGVQTAPLDQLGRLWLAIPLVTGGQQIGVVLTGPPRAPFQLDQEVFDLLRIVGREVATYVAEQRATRVLMQTRQLHDYGKRFAFVAHDIKNVSSQLSLLLSNAERHIANPAFQKDMLETVGASVQKITALLRRLDAPAADRAPAALAPVPQLEALVATYGRVRRAPLSIEHDGSTATVAIGADAFETAITHLLNNAIEASGGLPVLIRVRHEVKQVVIEIVDQGPGMTPDFIRDRLFQPFGTSKRDGSGIGAFQARELLREGGGDVSVTSTGGRGTTMRVVLPRADLGDAGVDVSAFASLALLREEVP